MTGLSRPLEIVATALAGPGTGARPRPVPGFVSSAFNPYVYDVAARCLRAAQQGEGAGLRTAIVLASLCGDATTADVACQHLAEGRPTNPLLFYQSVPTSILGHLAREFGVVGPVTSLASAGGMGADLVETADLLLSLGEANQVVLVGVELAPTPRTRLLHRQLRGRGEEQASPAGDVAGAMVVRPARVPGEAALGGVSLVGLRRLPRGSDAAPGRPTEPGIRLRRPPSSVRGAGARDEDAEVVWCLSAGAAQGLVDLCVAYDLLRAAGPGAEAAVRDPGWDGHVALLQLRHVRSLPRPRRPVDDPLALEGTSMITNRERRALVADDALGAGNALHRGMPGHRDPDREVLAFDPPRRMPDGQVRGALTAGELHRYAGACAGWHAARGVRPRDPVAVYGSSAVDVVLHYLGLTWLGAIPALVNGNVALPVAVDYLRRVGAVGVVTDRDVGPALAPDRTGATFLARTAETTIPGPPAPQPYRHDPSDPVLLTHSSGTTGAPKPVLMTHASLFAGVRHRLGLPLPQGADRILSALPPTHNSAVSLLLYALLSDLPVKVLSTQDAGVVLEHIRAFRPGLVAGFATTYAGLAERDLDPDDLSSVRCWWNSGDAAHQSHIRTLISVGRHAEVGEAGVRDLPGAVFVDGLGSSEMGHSLFHQVHKPGREVPPRRVGRPMAGVDAAVLSPDGELLPPYEVGRLGVKSPTLTPGYWNDSLTTHRSRLRGYWLTGDLVYRDAEGRFFHLDRLTDAIATSEGPLYSVYAEELILLHLPDVVDCTVIGEPGGEVSVLLHLRDGADLDPGGWRERVNAVLGAAGLPTVTTVRRAEDLVVGPTGKVRKRVLREREPAGRAKVSVR